MGFFVLHFTQKDGCCRRVFESINEKFDPVGLESVFPLSVFEAARPLLGKVTLPDIVNGNELAVQMYFENEALVACTTRGAHNLAKRSILIDTLLQELSRGGSQHWRYEVMSANLLEQLQRPDIPIDCKLVMRGFLGLVSVGLLCCRFQCAWCRTLHKTWHTHLSTYGVLHSQASVTLWRSTRQSLKR